MLNGFLDSSAWVFIGALLLLTHITIASVTIFLHRHQAHNALELHPLVSHCFRFWLWLTTGMVTKEWVAIHRKHHAKCETVDDPHSPQVKGIGKVLFEGTELYQSEAANLETMEKYGRGTPDDWLERYLYSRLPYLGIFIMLVTDIVLFGVFGVTVWAIQMLWIPFWAAGVVNGAGHFWGYRNFETQDASTNLSSMGILIGGEELHNNHHAYPASARLSNKWWEFDIGWLYIRILQAFCLARVNKVSPKTSTDSAKLAVDLDTLRAIVKNRYHVMTLYGREVIHPVIEVERKSADTAYRLLFKNARRLMIREGINIDDSARQTLQQAFHLSESVETVYRFKEQLKELWTQSSITQEVRFERLHDWCARAEESGIQALQNFVWTLRRYSLKPA